MYSYGPPLMAGQKQDDQHEHTFSCYVRIRDVALKTCQRRWTIGKSGERGSGLYVLAARHDDDDDDNSSPVSMDHACTILCFTKIFYSTLLDLCSYLLRDVCLECFCAVTHKKDKTEGKRTESITDIEEISSWMKCKRNHHSRVITQHQEAVAITSMAESKRFF